MLGYSMEFWFFSMNEAVFFCWRERASSLPGLLPHSWKCCAIIREWRLCSEWNNAFSSSLFSVRSWRTDCDWLSLCCCSRALISRISSVCWCVCSLFFLDPNSISLPRMWALWASQITPGEMSECVFSRKYNVSSSLSSFLSISSEMRFSLSFQLVVLWGIEGTRNWSLIGVWSDMVDVSISMFTVRERWWWSIRKKVNSRVGMMYLGEVNIILHTRMHYPPDIH